jgi:hypothetical protein
MISIFKKSSWEYKNMTPNDRGQAIVMSFMPLQLLLLLHIGGVVASVENNYIIRFFECFVRNEYSLILWLAYFIAFFIIYICHKKRKKYYCTLTKNELKVVKQQHKKYVIIWSTASIIIPFLCAVIAIIQYYIYEHKTLKFITSAIGVIIVSLICIHAKTEYRKRK